jgi:two-component system cell cycle response regulator DivK
VPKILLVEDNEMNRDMLSRRLQRKGYTVVVALDGAESIGKVETEAPDLILMDMRLPVMSGSDATRILKSAPGTRSIPVIALTANAMASDHEQAMQAGCDDYDTKPIDLGRLVEKIDKLLSRRAPV